MKTTYLMAALLAGVFAAGGSLAQSTNCAEQLDADYGMSVAGASSKSSADIAKEGVQCVAAVQAVNTADASTIASLKASNATLAASVTTAQNALAAKTMADAATVSGLQSQLATANSTVTSQAAEIAELEAELNQDNTTLSADSNGFSTVSTSTTTTQNPCAAWKTTTFNVPSGNSLAIPAGSYTCASLTQACYAMESNSDWNVCAGDAFQEWSPGCSALSGNANYSTILSLAPQCQALTA